MRGTTTRFGAGMVLAGLMLIGGPPAWGDSVPLHMLPKPVLDAVRTRFKDARIVGAEKDPGRRGFLYEVTVKHQGKNIDITLTPEGTILLIKREIAVGDLPAPVAKALADTYPDATCRSVEAVITVQGPEERLAYYEMDLVTAQRRLIEARVSVDGRILGPGR